MPLDTELDRLQLKFDRKQALELRLFEDSRDKAAEMLADFPQDMLPKLLISDEGIEASWPKYSCWFEGSTVVLQRSDFDPDIESGADLLAHIRRVLASKE